MALQRQRVTAEQFDDFIQQPDLGDRVFEFVGGEIIEMPSNPYSSKISQMIAGEIYIFLKGKKLGHLTGEAGLYRVGGERYAPDVGYISRDKQAELAHSGPNPNPPDLAVEVISDEGSVTEIDQLMLKVSNYVAAGTAVWVVYPQTKAVRVHVPGQPVQIIGLDGTLDGGTALPGFVLPLRDIFE